jgi:hypothetical protein
VVIQFGKCHSSCFVAMSISSAMQSLCFVAMTSTCAAGKHKALLLEYHYLLPSVNQKGNSCKNVVLVKEGELCLQRISRTEKGHRNKDKITSSGEKERRKLFFFISASTFKQPATTQVNKAQKTPSWRAQTPAACRLQPKWLLPPPGEKLSHLVLVYERKAIDYE